MTAKDIEELLLDISLFGIQRRLRKNEIPQGRNIVYGFIGELQIDGTTIDIILGFDHFFPQTIPYIIVIRNEEEIIPHIEKDGFVCYIQEEMVLDYTRPKHIIEDALQIASETITKSLIGTNTNELIDEFEDYWLRNEKCSSNAFFSCFDPPKEVTKFNSNHILFKKRKQILFGTDESLVFLNTDLLGFKRSNASRKSVVYIPISDGRKLLYPTYKDFWSFQQLRKIIWNDLDIMAQKNLEDLLANWRPNNVEYILLGIHSPIGIKLVGVECKNLNSLRVHPLNSESNIIRVSPIHISRYDENVLKARSKKTVKISKALILGCGSLGSRIATEIAQIGINECHLVDYDKLLLENIYRHQLGRNYVGLNKASAMCAYLKQRFPFEKFVSFRGKIEEHIEKNEIKLEEYDLIICATGSPNSSFYLNKFMKSNNIRTPIIYSWNEPYGIGGHNLLIQDQSISCYRCLYEEDGVTNRASFCEPGQRMLKKVSGCSSGFVPFSNWDCLRTCLDCLEILKSMPALNKLKSWKGDGNEFFAAGLEVTSRFDLSHSKLKKNQQFLKNKECEICKQGE